MNKPTKIIIHCSATQEGKNFKAKDIDQWHKQRGFKKIGYHYVIDLDGTVENGRDEAENGAHTVGHNTSSIGICYIGGLAKDGKTPKDTRTEEQKKSLIDLIHQLLMKYNLTIDDLYGHNNFANKACPSFDIEILKQEYNNIYNLTKNN